MTLEQLKQIANYIRYWSLVMTSQAGSGHPTSSLSAADLMTGLVYGGTFRFFPGDPGHPNNDRLIFSKGHASPLFYSLWAAGGKISDQQLLGYRKFGSNLEGHPTLAFSYTEVPTGSLGQGLSVGIGMAMNAKYLDKLPYRTFVLLGDSEMAEGSVWEAVQVAAHYKLDNLIGILDVNRLGQRGETMFGHDVSAYQKRLSAFGWETIVVDGHNLQDILQGYIKAVAVKQRPVMVIAKTLKGRGISFLENKDSWHGKALKPQELERALAELGQVNRRPRGVIAKPEDIRPHRQSGIASGKVAYQIGEAVATRMAYGSALARLSGAIPELVALDAEVSNSTFAEEVRKVAPHRFFEMFIAEQNMVGVATGLSRRGKIPFVSTFAAFFTRAFDQIRMSGYAEANVKFAGSHAGVSIGEDGASQMGLEDIALFRSVLGSTVLYPADAVSCQKLVEIAAGHKGNVYIRTTRSATPVIYPNEEKFTIGGSKTLRQSGRDSVTIVAAGITLLEALKAYERLKDKRIYARVIDLYSIKPLDKAALKKAAAETGAIVTAEDHYPEGGLGEAVASAVLAMPNVQCKIAHLAVRRMPRSGKPEELLKYEGIDALGIVKKVKEVLGKR